MRPTRLLGAVALMLASPGLFALPAALADPGAELQISRVDGREIELRLQLPPEVEPGSDPSPATRVQINGIDVEASANVDVTRPRATTAVLVLDSSGSLTDEERTAARVAIRDFVASLPMGTRYALINANDTTRLVVPPTTSLRELDPALAALTTGGDTPLLDAVDRARALIEGSSGGRIVVLSDGADNASTLTPAQVRSRLAESGIPVDVVEIGADREGGRLLNSLATTSGGSVMSGTDLASAFSSASQNFSAHVDIAVSIPVGLDARDAQVNATTTIDGIEYEANGVIPASFDLGAVTPAASVPESTETASVTPYWNETRNQIALIWALLAGIAVIGIFIIAESVARGRRRRQRLEQLAPYTRRSVTASDHLPMSRGISALNDIVQRLPSTRGTARRLAAAGMDITPAAWLLIRAGITISAFLLAALVTSSWILGIVVAVALGVLLPAAVLSRRARRSRESFADELPTFLLLLASALRSGLAFTQALDSATHDRESTVSREIRRALREVQVGAQLDAALMDVADRMDNEDLRWTVTALSIQREVGGNLSGILDAAAKTMQSREEIRREVRTLSAEGRLSAYILVALPLGVFAFLYFFRRDYISSLWTTTLGIVLLLTFIALLLAGWIWMRAVVRIRV